MTLTGTNKVILRTNNLTIGLLIGGSSLNYVVTDSTGSLTINNIGTSATIFPVGPSVTQYAPITITNNVNRNFSVKVGNAVTSPVFGYRYINHQWDITPSVLTGNSATLSFGWSASAHSANFNPAQLVRIHHYNTTSNTWDASFNATVAGANPYTATASGINVFSPFAVSNYTGVSVQTPPEKDKLKVYPNPVSNTLTIESSLWGLGASSLGLGVGDYHIFNLLGQEILRGQMSPLGVRGLDVSALPQGSYVLKVGTEQVRFNKLN